MAEKERGIVLPALAGMSPFRPTALISPAGAPRVSGDEPQKVTAKETNGSCSPR